MLTMYCEKKQDSWDEHLSYVMLAYRSSVHDSTGFSPNMMMLGRDVELPLQVVVSRPKDEEYTDPADYVSDLKQKMEQAHEVARKRLQRSAKYQKKYYDHRATAAPHFKCGDSVWYFCPTFGKGVCRKLTSDWKGPYVVVKKLSEVTFLLQKSRRSRPITCHVDKMKQYKGCEEPKWYKPTC